MSCSPSSGRSASVWVSSPGSSSSTAGSSVATTAARSPSVKRGVERKQDGSDLHQGVGEYHLLPARMHGDGGERATADSVGGEPPCDPGGLRLQLGIRDL